MRKMVRVALAAAAAGSAFGDISTSIVFVPGNPNYPNQHTWDLKVTVSGGDDWTSSSMKASISGGNFYNHPLGANTQPNPFLFPGFPEMEWDTFVTHPEGWPNTAGQGHAPGFAGLPSFTPTTIDVTWFDNLPNAGDGTWTIARLTVENISPAWAGFICGAHTTKKGLGTLFPYCVIWPEPGTLSLLVLGGMAALIRRR